MPDTDLEIRGGGGGGDHSDPPLDKGEGPVSKKIFPTFRASVWSKNKTGRGGGASPGSASEVKEKFFRP